MLLLIILIILIFGTGLGGNFYGGGVYRNQGFGLGGLLVIILLVLLVTGNIRL